MRSAPVTFTRWLLVTGPLDFSAAVARPAAVFINNGGTLTISDGATTMTLGPGIYMVSPLLITAVTGTAYILD
jgi:hypothetical protein